MKRNPKSRRKPMPKPSRQHEDKKWKLNGKRFKNWSEFADFLYLELKNERRAR